MDGRDFDFWSSEAERSRIREEMVMMSMARLAMWGDKSAYEKVISSLERQLDELEGTKMTKIEDRWAELQAIGRR